MIVILGGIACVALFLAFYPADDVIDPVEPVDSPIRLSHDPALGAPFAEVEAEGDGKVIHLIVDGRHIARLRATDLMRTTVEFERAAA